METIDWVAQRIPVEPDEEPPPRAVRACLGDAERRTRRALDSGDRIVAFAGSNYLLAWRVLNHIAVAGLAPGPRFCEWGSGAGIVTCLAQQTGFQACGIEREDRLVALARGVAASHAPSARFHRGSYQPPGLHGGSVDVGILRSGFDPTAFDLVYVYPWPAEERAVFDLFLGYCPADALLVTYHGGADIRVHRKVAAG